MLKVIDVDYLDGYRLKLKFNNSVSKIADLEPYLHGEVFGELRDKNLFIQYALTTITIEWVNGADLAPEFLFDIGQPI